MDLSGHINDLVTVGKEMRNQPGVNKQWLNKTIAQLEEAAVFAKEIQPGKVLGVPINPDQPVHGSADPTCICPPGARDRSCPALTHNN